MQRQPKPTLPSGEGRSPRIPRIAKYLDTAVAVILLGLSAYHYTQPNGAWRSGTTELSCGLLLLAAVYLASPLKAIFINLAVSAGIIILGIRHIIHGGGWRSGSLELFFAVLLIAVACLIWKNRIQSK